MRLPSTCVCGSAFTVEHSLSCPHDAFPSIRHDRVRDLTANLLTEVCHGVEIEPHLQPLTGEQPSGRSAIKGDNARQDIKAMVSGGTLDNRLSLMSESSTHLPHPIQLIPCCLQEARKRKEKRI